MTTKDIIERKVGEFQSFTYLDGIKIADAEVTEGVRLDDWLRQTLTSLLEEERERIKELVAHSSYKIDPGGRVSKRHDDAETICHGIIEDIDALV